MRGFATAVRSTIAACAAVWLGMCSVQAEDAETSAKSILEASGLSGGIIVHLGSGSGELTAALHADGRFTVHGLDSDPSKVKEAREYVQRRGLYGAVSIEQIEGLKLPYADNLVNLVVAEDLGGIPMHEVLRVLVPEGVACLRESGRWKKTVKPRPEDIDDWPHFLHDAGNNAVARDTVVGPPRSLQWIAPPLWLRSHETPSGLQSQICAGRRLFYIFDEGPVGIIDERLPDRWSLVARDAFNGKLLWKRPIEPWGWREWARKKWEGADWTVVRGGRVTMPNENQRRLAAAGDRLYATLGFRAPLCILDAATGKVLATVKGSEGASEILTSDGVVLACVKDAASAAKKRRGKAASVRTVLVAAAGDTGRVLWKRETGAIGALLVAIDRQRVVYRSGRNLAALGLKDGNPLWKVTTKQKGTRTLVAHEGIVLLKGRAGLEARDAGQGTLLWQREVLSDSGAGNVDLFVANGLVWTGMCAVDENLKPTRSSADAMAVGLDPRSGQQRKRIVVPRLRSFEHHHRCYRNKATDRYMISGMEGAEYMDLRGDDHSQENWLRGACKLGVTPCNGMLYVSADQCFCQPGAKLLGFAAIGPAAAGAQRELADEKRLQRGPAYGAVLSDQLDTEGQWPTYRHDARRSGATDSAVPPAVTRSWSKKLGGRLTAPVAAGGKVLVAECDAHTIHALDASSGAELWKFTTGGRIDSPPTVFRGLVLSGSKDGRVYCLRESDGELVWRFTAAPSERRIGFFDQLESAWPVHGSVLISEGVAYFTAGRSTYLDGGIRVWGLDPATGKIVHKGLLEGPRPWEAGRREYAFYTLGANSDVLVAEGDHIYMRQKKLSGALEEVTGEVLSTKGEMDLGLHVFSTAGLLDGSWYNRTFWMYSKRWPGFQLANQAPKSGQLLVVGDEATYAVKVFYRRNTHSPMFFPAKQGYLVFADKNSNEPQIVGEEGARTPIAWLPQSDFSRGPGRDMRKLDSPAFGLDKMIGYTRAEPPLWARWLAIRVRAMVKAGGVLFVAGPPDVFEEQDPFATFEGRRGARLAALSTRDGKQLSQIALDHPPVFDGMIAAAGQLFVSSTDGSLVCLGGRK